MACKNLPTHFFLIFTCFTASTVSDRAIIHGDVEPTSFGIHEFSYQVSLQIPNRGHVCGGGIIDEKFILTAAHCVVNEKGQIDVRHMSIIAGTNDLDHTAHPAMIINVKKIYAAKEYLPYIKRLTGDIAVLKLKEPLKLSANIRKLELPRKNTQETYGRQTVKIAGWGADHVKIIGRNAIGKSSDSLLRHADATVVVPGQVWFSPDIDVDKQICARVKQRMHVGPRGVCFGDSGGPLVFDGQILIGIQSMSPWDCSEKIIGATYTRVSHYIDLIENAIQDRRHKDIVTLEFA